MQKLNSELKQTKKQLIKFQVPLWASQINNNTKVPFLYLELDGIEGDELKNIITELEKKISGLFLIISKQPSTKRISFIAHVSKNFENQIDMKEFLNFLKGHGFGGGGSKTTIQGGGVLDESLKKSTENFLAK
jgi:alanyl-tRNA synthetase